MTRLFDLPNELLLLVAAAVDVVERRRLSKTCRACFHLLRSQRNKNRFDIKEKRSLEMKLHHLSDQLCVLRLGEYEYADDDVPYDVRVFVLIATDTIPDSLSTVLDNCTVPSEAVGWICCTNPLSQSMKMIEEGREYFEIEHFTYEAHFDVLNVKIVKKCFTICSSIGIVINNDGFYNDSVHKRMRSLLTAFVKYAEKWPESRRHLIIKEQFTRKCCAPVLDELKRIDDSSQRLLNLLRKRKWTSERRILDCCPITNSSERRLCVQLNLQGIVSAYVGNERLDDMALLTPCVFHYQQLKPQQAAIVRLQEFWQVVGKIEVQKQQLERLQGLEQQIREQQNAAEQQIPEMAAVLQRTSGLRWEAEQELLEEEETLQLFFRLEGVKHRQ